MTRIIQVAVSPKANKVLARKEVRQAAKAMKRRAEKYRDWKPGKTFVNRFTKGPVAFLIAIDYRSDGYHVNIGLPHEIEHVPNPATGTAAPLPSAVNSNRMNGESFPGPISLDAFFGEALEPNPADDPRPALIPWPVKRKSIPT